MRKRKLLSILICAVLVAVMAVPMFGTATVSAATDKTVYVSSSTGSDTNNGSEAAPFATIQRAWANSNTGEFTIIIVDTVVLGSSSFEFDSENKASYTTIKGATASSVLDLSVKTMINLSCVGGLTIDNLTVNFTTDTEFAANGRKMLITETVTFNNRIKIFGGGRSTSVTGDTDLTVLGGIYNRIYGGGYGGSVTGDVNLTIGGVVNSGDGIDDEASSPVLSPCQVYGGCYNGSVGGDVTINFGGSAVTRYISGNGAGAGSIGGKITVNITGGKATAICGTRSLAMTDAKIYINMTGGLCESIFGGAEGTSVSGDIQIYLGANADISRRVFGGCYNDTEGYIFPTLTSSNHVTGTITVLLEPGCKVGSGTGLSLGNRNDMGLCGTSRYDSAFSDEISTVIFLNGNAKSNYSMGCYFGDHTDYFVNAAAGGTVESAMNGTAALTMLPDENKVAVVGSTKYLSGDTYTLSSSTTGVSFADIATYNVTLNANNGTDAAEVIKKYEGFDLTLPATAATYENMTFAGWATSAEATEAEYQAGDKYTAESELVLYAVWVETPIEYSVMHILVDENGTSVYKTERLYGYAGDTTEAKALEWAGYIPSDIDQEVLSRDEVVFIAVTYKKGDFSVGDVNCDGTIDMLDLAILDRHIAGWDGYDEAKACHFTTDCNADSVTDSADSEYLAKYLAGWSDYVLN